MKECKKFENELFVESDEVSAIVLSLTAKINSLLNANQAHTKRNSTVNAVFRTVTGSQALVQVKLSKIDVPKFNSDPRKFLDFIGLLKNLVRDDPNIPNV